MYQGMAFLFLSARKHTFFTAGAAEYTHDFFLLTFPPLYTTSIIYPVYPDLLFYTYPLREIKITVNKH